MTGSEILLALGAVATVLASWLAARAAGRSSVKVAEIGADQGAFVRAEAIYKNAIARLEGDLFSTVKELKETRRELDETRGALQIALDQITRLTRRLDGLEGRESERDRTSGAS